MTSPAVPSITRTAILCLTFTLAGSTLADTAPKATSPGVASTRKVTAKQAFKTGQTILFQDNFQSEHLERWNLSENDSYNLASARPECISVVDAPGLLDQKAAHMTVQREPNSFRSEISLPSENGFQERWYAQRLMIPSNWVFDPGRAHDIVMQWHGIPGNWRPTFPNLDIAIGNDRWFIKQSYGSPQTKPTRTTTQLEAPVQRGVWTSWVIHAKWSPKDDGLLQIWQDGKMVYERSGPNVYGTIGVEYTPYLKTGVYHPEWHTDTPKKLAAFEQEQTAIKKKDIYVTDVKVGSEKARYEDVAPATR